MKIFLTFLLYWLTCNIMALKIYQSNVIFEGINMISGIFYQNENKEKLVSNSSLTACIRLNMKQMSSDNTIILMIGNSKYENFLRLQAQYPTTWFHFGNLKSSWILKDVEMKTYFIWRIDNWHHTCFSYEKSNFYISFVKVRSKAKCYKNLLCLELLSGYIEIHSQKGVTSM